MKLIVLVLVLHFVIVNTVLYVFLPFFSGESIAISADFENHSSRTIIPYATLHQTQTFFANGKSRVRATKFTVLTGIRSLVVSVSILKCFLGTTL